MHLLAKHVVVPGYLVNMLLRDPMGIFWASLSSDEAGLKECLFSTWEATDAEWLVWPSTRKGISALRSTLAASRHPYVSSYTWQHSRFHLSLSLQIPYAITFSIIFTKMPVQICSNTRDLQKDLFLLHLLLNEDPFLGLSTRNCDPTGIPSK